MQSDLMLAIKLYMSVVLMAVCLVAIGWLACMIYYHIDPSGLDLYKAIHGTV